MNAARVLDVLNRLYVLHARSLPTYLGYAHPWQSRGDEQASLTLQQIAADHAEMADRMGHVILRRDGVVEHGEFPMDYTDTHDLSLRFLLKRLIDAQQTLVSEIEGCVRGVEGDKSAKALADEALGMAKGHLDSLLELAGAPAG